MKDTVAQRISLFRSHILNRRLDGAALRVIESAMASKDVKSSMEVRSSLWEFIRSESMSIIRENAEKPVEKKLLDLDFLVRAFALLGDVEASCLALRYEALLLREFKSTSCQWLEVSCTEWLNFAEQSLDYGFHSIVRKACENALLCFQKTYKIEAKTVEFFEGVEIIEKIRRLKECALTSAASRSVQAQAAKYMKSKLIDRTQACPSVSKRTLCLATTFRNGIRKRNLRSFRESQSLLKMTDEPNTSRS
ncbi:hypothetical protein PanWU01x14_300440 [Parasponia andersonii]|uniref:Uncharacterized protein n=1 Tax=Parasponia andersonii TaxID=3476 RepID=A0A2P5AU00_PARAD|nr:hypothetical protein PanWU01x14_300440 [Parasponia andersonii]